MKILYVKVDAFNVLIKSLKEKIPKWNRTILDCERLVTKGRFLWKKIAMENAYIIDIWDRKRLIKYSLNYNFNILSSSYKTNI